MTHFNSRARFSSPPALVPPLRLQFRRTRLTCSFRFAASARRPCTPPAGLLRERDVPRLRRQAEQRRDPYSPKCRQQAFSEISKAMTPEGLKKQGVIVEKKENITLKNRQGRILHHRPSGSPRRENAQMDSDCGSAGSHRRRDGAGARSLQRKSIPMRRCAKRSRRSMCAPSDADGGAGRPAAVQARRSCQHARISRRRQKVRFSPDFRWTEKDSIDAAEQPLLVVSAAPGGPTENVQREVFARETCSPEFQASRMSKWSRAT